METSLRTFLFFSSMICMLASSSSHVSEQRRLLRNFPAEAQQQLPGFKLGMTRLDKWGSFDSLSSLTQSLLDDLLHGVVNHDLMRAQSLFSRLVSVSNTSSTPAYDYQLQRAEKKTKQKKAQVVHDLVQTPVSFTNGGIYYSTITLGSPPKEFSLVMDTGSDLTWVRCDACAPDCSSTFNRLASKTYKALTCSDDVCSYLRHTGCSSGSSSDTSGCRYSYGYGDGSFTRGDLSVDTLKMTGASSDKLEEFPNFVFGCGSLLKGLISGEVGILALSPGNLSFPSQIGAKYGNKFSYCLLRQTGQNSLKKSPLIFGEAAAELKEPGSGKVQDLQYTPIGDSSIYFTVQLDGISVGNQRLDLPPSVFFNSPDQPTIFDSGTTLTMLPAQACDSIKTALTAAIPGARFVALKGLDACFLTPPPRSTLPDITFHFKGGADYVTPPVNYLIDLGSLQCLIFVPTSEVSIVGNIQQQDFFVVHDMDNRRIGFKATDCGDKII